MGSWRWGRRRGWSRQCGRSSYCLRRPRVLNNREPNGKNFPILFAGLLFAAGFALHDHRPLVLSRIEPFGIESNRQVVAAVARHVHERGSQELKKRRLLLDNVEAMRLLTLILDSNSAVSLRIGRQLNFPGLSFLRGLLGPGLSGKKNCAGKQSGYK